MKKHEMLYNTFCDTVEKHNLLKDIDKIIFLFSGGKDATLGLYFLQKYIKEQSLEINIETILVTYPLHCYFTESGSEAECFVALKNYWFEQDVVFHVFVPETSDIDPDDALACKTCKVTRKNFIDKFLNNIDNKERTAIMTGYTLYDVLAFLDEILLITNYDLKNYKQKSPEIVNRVENCLHKMSVREALPNGFRMIRPLVGFGEEDIRLCNKELDLPFSTVSCEAAKVKLKRQYFKVLDLANPTSNTTHDGVMNFLKEQKVEIPKTYHDIEYDNHFTDC